MFGGPEGRNLEAVLDLMASGRLKVNDLVTHSYDFGRAAEAYEVLGAEGAQYLGIQLNYPSERAPVPSEAIDCSSFAIVRQEHRTHRSRQLRTGGAGAGDQRVRLRHHQSGGVGRGAPPR